MIIIVKNYFVTTGDCDEIVLNKNVKGFKTYHNILI